MITLLSLRERGAANPDDLNHRPLLPKLMSCEGRMSFALARECTGVFSLTS